MAEPENRAPSSSPEPEAASLRQRRFLAVGLMAVAALFCGVVAGVMVTTWFSEWNRTPPTSAKLESLRVDMGAGRGGSEAQDAFRKEDARLRRLYFTYRRRLRAGAYLLLIAGIGLVLCGRWYASLDPGQPMPRPLAERTDPDRWLAERRRRVWGGGAAAMLVAAGLVAFGLAGGGGVPTEEALKPKKPAHSFKDNWPVFRGPTGMGIVPAGDWPTKWDAASGENVLWKTAVSGPGKNSPILWGDRIFLTTGDEERRQVVCFDRATGAVLWQSEITSPPKDKAEEDEQDTYDDTGYAAPTAATDGQRVYATFGTADLAAVDFTGRVVWKRNFGPPDNVYGMASSLNVFEGRVLFQLDRGMDGQEGKSMMLSLDGATGETVWSTPRPVGASWSSPVLARTPTGPRIFTCGAPWVIAYEPKFGAELWRVEGLSGDIAPSAVYADGRVYVTNEYAEVIAIRCGGTGTVTETHVVWKAEEGMSDAPSPICDGKLFLQVHSSGLMTCYDAQNGKMLWEHDLERSVWASPLLVGTSVYLTEEKGRTHIFELARQFKAGALCALGEPVYASLAFGDGQIYIRGDEHLYCIGPKVPTTP